MRRLLALILFLLCAAVAHSTFGQIISEFLTQNNGLLLDEDGDSPDWIEIQNPTSQPVHLLNWALTDVRTNLVKWPFPDTNIVAGGFVIVFASGKDRRVSGAPLHANFRLDTEGEYLALVAPNGLRIASEYAPAYPAQLPNISYGIRQRAGSVSVLKSNASGRYRVPASAAEDASWTAPDFNDSSWSGAVNGVGFETTPADYAGLIATDVRLAMAQSTSCYVRLPFVVDNPADYSAWRLLVQYDDGFVAYLNGQEVARANAPETPAWNSAATAGHPDDQAVIPEEFDLTSAQDLIIRGTNVLALHGLNSSTTSSDFLVLATIEAQPLTEGSPVPSYFTVPTPGERNVGGVDTLGPILSDVTLSPARPLPAQALAISAHVASSFRPVAGVQLHYRVMFQPEVTVAMLDDGAHADGAAHDGTYGAVIPASSAGPGEMIRYFVTATDSEQNSSRLPLFLDARESAQYYGTVLADSSVQSKLPVVDWFIENPSRADTQGGARCSIAFLGEFYDNVLFSLHGQSSSGFPKRGYNLDFPRDHRFRYATNAPRVKDIKLLTNYADKSRTRNTLAYDFIREAGSVGHFAFPVRVQQNGEFHAILDLMEDADDRWLERVGRDPNGALYKVYNALDSAGGNEKKTRKNEGTADLQSLITNLAGNRSLADRVTYAYDNIDLPQTVSYFVGLALISSQDHGHKNFFMYRDSDGSGEWAIFPWDVDLSWGRNWIDAGGYFTDRLYTNNVLNFYNGAQQNKPSNRLYNLIFSHPDFRRMYLRRLRTVMDTLLQPPGTPPAQLKIEKRIRELVDLMDPPEITPSDADLDYQKWGSWGNGFETRPEAQRIIDLHLPGRRDFLFNSPTATLNGEGIPPAQDPNAVVTIGAIDFNPASGSQEEEFIELINPHDVALDVSGWKVEGAVELTLRPGTVLPAGSRLYLSPNVRAFRARTAAPRGGLGLAVQGDYPGQLSARGESLRIVNDQNRVVASTNYPGLPTAAQQFLKITELMYHPAPPPPGSPYTDEDFEFIELKNAGSTALDLSGIRFTNGIAFSFTGAAARQLAPGELILVVRNVAAFASRYGAGLKVAGPYLGALDNAGEKLKLVDAVGEVVFEFDYSPEWLPSTDGEGYSLEVSDPDQSLDSAKAWRASAQPGGSPGQELSVSAVLLRTSLVHGTFVISFTSAPGRAYSLFHRTSLFAGEWELVRPIAAPAQGSDWSVEIPIADDAAPHFYRVQ